MEIAFWILFLVVFYTFAGYAFLLFFLLFVKRLIFPRKIDFEENSGTLPRVCLFVAAYNENRYVGSKLENLLSLDYPADKIQYLWITDGSDDGTPQLLKKYPSMEVQHLPERKGKIHAMNRGMRFVDAPIVIFSDCNAILCQETIQQIVKTFRDPRVGCIAGEKRIVSLKTDGAAGSGENQYWKFESGIKRMESELNSVVGAVGELFAIRTSLYPEVESDTILDDFVISLRIAEQGYRIAYTPEAYSTETASENIEEELKRKIRIAAGGLQALARLRELLNPFRFGFFSIQYFSHKVLRWTIAPLALFLLFFLNLIILLFPERNGFSDIYFIFFCFQVSMYLFALAGWMLEQKKIRIKMLFIPYYFTFMNYASILGWIRFLKGKQSVNWEKVKRA